MKKTLILCLILPFCTFALTLESPQKAVQVTVRLGDRLSYTLSMHGKPLIVDAPVALTFRGMSSFGERPRLRSVKRRTIDEIIVPTVPEKFSRIRHFGNEMTLSFIGGYRVVFRAYDNGFAYRWITDLQKPVIVEGELVDLPIADAEATAYIPLLSPREGVDLFHTSYEENYTILPLRSLTTDQIGYLPLLIKFTDGRSMVITEADLDDYPGLYLCGRSMGSGLSGVFPAYPLEERIAGDEFKQKVVVRRADYLAETTGARAFPWRVMLLAGREADLLENTLVYCLAPACRLPETDWIRPGKCTDDWTIDTNLYGVPFRAGLNTETYKFYIDFAARFRIPYVMLDAGWSNNDDLFQINPKVDFEGVLRYAKEKGVGLFLWTLALTLDRQLEEILPRFQRWGIKGIMVDFMDRDDQQMVRFYRRIAEATARHQLMVLFHGAYKPTGLRREFPNVITREAVLGHEYNKWSDRVTPEHIACLPFIRMTAGPLDFEGGSMLNVHPHEFHPFFSRPMSQGTRIHELALYVIFESPLQYQAGNPSDYLREPDFTQFLVDIPTIWDETKAIDGAVGEYVLLARRRGTEWHLAAISDRNPRRFEVPLSFLDNGLWQAEIWADGINADRYASDYRQEQRIVTSNETLRIDLAPSGGFVARFRRSGRQ
ncbi:MAG: glycoside hydrolase family 97 protein [candidate division KSB1 bacterium]|nr:glycoside hydrolase family 97 protein [candidate division KSB1 bacterium]